MSAINRATLRATIRLRGDYTNVRRFPDTYLNTEIQTAFGKFYQLVADTHEGWWDIQGPLSTVAAQAYVAMPTDCWRAQALDILHGDRYCEMPQIGLGDRNRYGASTARPVAYRTSSRGFELYPTPDAVYTLRINYTPKAPDLDESTTQEWYNGWEDFVIEAVLLELATREGMPLGDRVAKLKMAADIVTSGASERRSQEPEYLHLREQSEWGPYGSGGGWD